MKRLLLLILLFSVTLVYSQSITNYTFSAASGTFTPIVGGTAVATSVSAADFLGDTKTSVPIPIGFNFIYMGVPYNQVVAMSDGYLSFNLSATSSLTNNLATSAATQRPLVAPLWDDLDGASGTGAANYITTGSPGSRIFTLEWLNWQWNYNATGTTISFQVKLYEATGVVEFVYRDDGGTVNSGSASIGITAIGTGSGNYLSLNGTGASPTASSTTETTSLSTKPASGQTYTFTPPASAPTAPTSLSFSPVGLTSMTLNWVDSPDETGYVVYRSTDGTNYSLVTSTPLAANTITYPATGLNPGTSYYWRVFAVNEGKLSDSLGGIQATTAPSLSGTKYVGSGTNPKDYDNLTLAFTDISNNGLAGNLTLIIQSGYPDVAETYPIEGPIVGVTGSYTVTIYPDGSGYTITSASAIATVRLNGSQNVIFDGRVGGTGSTVDLTISNTGTGPALLFINDASNNTIKYCNVVGTANTANTSGVILFSTTTGTTGNDNNTIDNCDINAFGSAVGINSTGTTGKENSGNLISNNKIRNFYISSASTTSTYGIKLSSGSTDFTITGNSLYQEAPRAYSATAAIHYMISCSNTSGNNFVVTNNHMGGNSPNSAGTYTISSGQARLFVLEINVGTTSASSVQGNIIRNIDLTTAFAGSGSSGFIGIYVSAGNVNIGNTSGNTIGSNSATNSIVYNNNGTDAGILFLGANLASSGTVVFNNNKIGGLTGNVSTASVRINLYGITTSGSGQLTISGNTVGSTTVANSIINNAGNTTTNFNLRGINSTSTNANVVFSNNTVANLTMTAVNTGPSLVGIYCGPSSSSTNYTLTGNTVYNLTTASTRTSTGATAPLIGIAFVNGTAGGVHNISGNIVHSLISTAASAALDAYGIYISNASSTVSTVSGNFVHSISFASTGICRMMGIYNVNCALNINNNMVRLGIDNAGNSVTGGYWIAGIWKETTQRNSIMHNSVYIGGTSVAGTQNQNTFAFRRSGTGTTDSLMNNILFNARSNSTSSGSHFSVYLNSTTSVVSNYNLFYVNGTGGVFGYDGTANRATLAAWQTATSKDANSGFGDPNYVLPSGSSSLVDLHVQSPTPIEAAGTLISYILTDFDGQTRSGLSPVDIGADADNFTAADIFAPTITYTTLPNTGLITNRTLASVTISDASGVPTSGTLQPRIWYRRSGPVVTGWATNQGTLMSGTGTSGTWDFVIDYTFLAIVPAVGDVFEYYVVAQDIAGTPNISTNPAGGVHVDVNIQTTPPPAPNTYSVVQSFAGPLTVGTPGGMFTDLTSNSPTGLFASINAGVVTGPITVQVISNLAEPGTNGLNQWIEEGGSGFTMTIQPAATPTAFTISGAFTGGLIRLNGADRVTIDGRVGGVGPGGFLFFRSTDLINSTIVLQNDASNNTIRNCIIEGANNSATQGVLFITPGAVNVTGNDNNLITENTVKDRSDVAGVPVNLIYSAGWSTTVRNSNNTISNNECYNFTGTGIFLASANSGNENFTVTGNYIFQFPPTPRTTALYGMQLNTLGTNNLISQNTINDLTTSSTAYGIYIDDIGTATISRNRIYNFLSTSGSTSTLIGIYVWGATNGIANILNNQISLIPAFTNAQTIYGIRDWGNSGDIANIYYNSVYIGGTGSGSSKTYAFDDNTSSTTTVLRNNSFVNARTGGTGGHFAARHASTSAITDMNSNYNFFSGNGPTPANFFELSSTATLFTGFKAAFTGSGKDANSWVVDGSGLIAANLYNNVSTGDLNINTGNTEAWYVNGKGTQISGLTDDFGALGVRSDQVVNGSTDIGADEFVPSSLPITATASGAPAPSTTTTYSFAGRQLGSITWGAGGTVPTAVNFNYYSGTWPTGASGNYSNAYYDITVPDGSGYTYDITFNYDPAIIGTIPSEGLMKIAKNDGSWVQFASSTVNTSTKEVTLTGLSSFSLFTFGDENNPVPIEISTFTAKSSGRNIVLNWQTTTEVNSSMFEIQRSKENTSEWTSIGKVNAAGNSNSPLNYSFTDNKLSSGKFNYRLKMVDADGRYSFSNVVESEVELPKEYAISQNYPNPFNPSTRIDYQLPFDSKVTLELYGITGEKVATVINSELSAGYYTADINAGALNLASGMYIYRIVAVGANNQNFTQVKKLMLTK